MHPKPLAAIWNCPAGRSLTQALIDALRVGLGATPRNLSGHAASSVVWSHKAVEPVLHKMELAHGTWADSITTRQLAAYCWEQAERSNAVRS